MRLRSFSILHFTFYIESGSQAVHLFRFIALQADADGDPLLHFYEITRGIILRYEGKSRSRGIRYGFHYTSIYNARNGIGRKSDFRPLFSCVSR